MKETGRIKLKEIPFSRTFETGNGEELCNATGYAVQFDNEKTPLGFPLFWNEFQDREGNLYYGNQDQRYEIIGYMDANEKLTETGNDFTIKLSTCERRTVDTKRLEADLGSLAEYQRVSQDRRLCVK